MFEDFVSVLSQIDNLILVDIYAAREKNIYNIGSVDLANAINNKYKKDVVYIDSFEKCVEYIIKNAKSGDIVVSMGAGDVFKITDKIITKLSLK